MVDTRHGTNAPLPGSRRFRVSAPAKIRLPAAMGFVGGIRRDRSALLRTTALQAAVLAVIGVPGQGYAQTPAMPAANQLPTGGKVIGGTASIATSGATMQVVQSTANATVNWNAFSVGSNAKVQFQQPSSNSVVINRVIGPDPSVIAGRIAANGQVVLTNQSGVVFTRGSQVDVQSLIVSAPGISEANAKAGKLIFDIPANPSAKIVNEGVITVGQTGLAALVAPQVVNNGVIRAQMGKVILAGAEAHTIDLYGDGLLSIDVTKQVSSAPVGADGKAVTTLVTNSGTIQADGGSVLLTASAVDGIVQTLVNAGGTVSAATMGTQTGRIAVTGTGGGVTVTGNIAARGEAAGTKGGEISVNTPGKNVTVATGARIDASGQAGGGTVAVGATIARAKAGPSVAKGAKAPDVPTAKNVTIEAGATLAADALSGGNGGNVTVLSQGGATRFRGDITGRGGDKFGDGGFVEVSGDRMELAGTISVAAAKGAAGTILFDPENIEVKNGGAGAFGDAIDGVAGTLELDADTLTGLSGAVVLQASKNITVSEAIDFVGTASTVTDFSLFAGDKITINAAITATGNVTLTSAATVANAVVTTGGMTINAAVSTSGASKVIALSSGAGGITLNGDLLATAGSVTLATTGGGVTQSGGVIKAGTLSSTGVVGDVGLSKLNEIGALGDFSVTGGDFNLIDTIALDVTGTVSATNVSISDSAAGTALTISGSISSAATKTTDLTATTGSIALTGTVDATGTGTLDLNAATGVSQTTGSVTAGTLISTGGITGTVDLGSADNAISALGGISVTTGDLRLRNTAAASLSVEGAVAVSSGQTISLATDRFTFGAGTLSAGTGVIEIGPVSGTTTVTIGAAAASGIEAGDLSKFTAGTIRLGSSSVGGATTAASIGLDGNATTAGILELNTSGAVTQTTGTLSAGTLAGSADSFDIQLAGNKISKLGDTTVTGAFSLVDDAALDVTGSVSAASVTITNDPSGASLAVSGSIATTGTNTTKLTATTGSISLVGTIDAGATGTVDLSAANGSIFQSGGKIVAGVLTSSGGAKDQASFSAATNAVAAVGDFAVSAGDFTLVDSLAVDVTGTVSATNASITDSAAGVALTVSGTIATAAGNTTTLVASAGSISLTGDLAATSTGTVDLSAASGGVSQTGGKITAGVLQSTSGITGDATLTRTTNAIGSVADIAVSSGNFTLVDSLAVDVTGTVSATNASITDSAAGVALTVSGTIATAAGNTTTLVASAGSILLTGDLNATSTGTVDLSAASGGVSQTGGKITAGVLQSTSGITGDATLTRTTNAIGSVADIAVSSGNFTLVDSLSVDVTGTVSATNASITDSAAGVALTVSGTIATSAGNTTTLVASAGSILLTGDLNATSTGTVDLSAASGGVSQTGGKITAGVLQSTSGITGDATLTRTTNAIGSVADIAVSSGNFTLVDSLAVDVTGTVSATNASITDSAAGVALTVSGTIATAAGNTTTLVASAGSISLTGDLAATSTGTVDLSAASGGVSQTGGKITAGVLQSTSGITGDATLTRTTNAIGSVADIAVSSGNFTLVDSLAVDVTGTVSATNASITDSAAGVALTVSGTIATAAGNTTTLVASAGSILLTGDLNATSTGTVDLSAASGGVSQTGGKITAGVLQSTSGITGDATLTRTTNAIGSVADIAVSSGNFTLVDSLAVDVTGTVSATNASITDSAAGVALTVSGTIATAAGNTTTLVASAGSISLTGDLAATSTGTVDLSAASGGVSQTGGKITAGVLQSTSGITGDATLTRTTNAIGSVADIAVSSGNFTLVDSLAVDVTGTVSATNASITDSAAGVALTVSGTIATAAGNTTTLVASAGSILLTGDLAATSTGTVDLSAASGGVSQTGGKITAGVLQSTSGITGDATLTRTTNAIGSVADIAVSSGNFTLVDSLAVDVTGTVSATNASITDSAAGVALTVSGTIATAAGNTTTLVASAGSILLTGDLNATSTGTVDLSAASGGVSQTGGKITAGVLQSTSGITGDATLTRTTNAIGSVADIAVSSGNFTLVDSLAVDVTGTVSATNASITDSAAGVALTVSGTIATAAGNTTTLVASAGSILLTGDLNATSTGTVDLSAASGGVSQTGGKITAGVLQSTSGITGDATLTRTTNAIGSVADIAVSSGNFTLVDSLAVDVTGTVSATNASITDSAAGVALTVSGTIATAAGNTTTLVASAGSILLTGDLNATSTGTVDLSAASGGVSQTGGKITAGVLQSTSGITGDATLTRTTNAIGSVADIAVSSGNFTLVDSLAVDVTGTVSATNASITDSAAGVALTVSGTIATAAGNTTTLVASAGSILLTGDLAATSTGTVDLSAASGGVSQTGGKITAGVLQSTSGITGDATLTRTTNAIGSVADIAVSSGNFTLVDSLSVDVTGTVSATNASITDSAAGVALTVSGTIATSAGNTTTLVASAGSISLTGDLAATSTGTVDLSAASGGVSQTGGKITAGVLQSTSGITGDATLTRTTNAIGSVADIAVSSGNFTLVDSLSVDVTGTVSATNASITDSAAGVALTVSGTIATSAGNTTTLVASAGSILLTGDLNATSTGTVDLSAASGGVSQTGGKITAGVLQSTSGITGDATLTRTTNAIGSVADIAVSSGNFTLVDSLAVDVTGTVSATNASITDSAAGVALTVSGTIATAAGNTTTLVASAGSISLTGDLAATSTGTVDLSAASGGVSQTGGKITAGVLQSTSGITGDATLTRTTNAIGSVADIAVSSGNFTLVDSLAVDVTGTVSATNASITDSAAGVALTVSGTIATAAGNTTTLVASAGSILLTGDLNATSTGTVDLSAASGGVSQTGGKITAGVLQSTSGITGDATLTRTTNAIGSVADIAVSSGNFTLVDSLAVDVTGTVSATNASITDSAAGVALTVSGTIATSAGTIDLATTTGSIVVSGLVSSTPTGSVNVSAASGLIQSGGTIETQELTVTALSGGISQAGGTVSANLVDFSAVGGITQSAGSIIADTLQSTGGVTGDVSLVSATNSIGTVGNFAVTSGNLSLTDSAPVTLAGNISAGNLTFLDTSAAVAITITGQLATGGTLTLNSPAGGITQATSSIIDAAVLRSAGANGTVDLTGTGNSIDRLAEFAVPNGDFSLTNAIAMDIAGVLTVSNGNATITDTASGTAIKTNGDITVSGTLSLIAGSGVAVSPSETAQPAILFGESTSSIVAAEVVVLQSKNTGLTTAVSQTSLGSIQGILPIGATLSGTTADGDVVLTSPTNRVATLGSFGVTSGNLSIVDNVSLSIDAKTTKALPGSVTADNFTLVTQGTAGRQNVSITGNVIVPDIFSVTANGTVVRTLGTLQIGTLTGSAIETADFGAASLITKLGKFSVTGSELVINNDQPLTITGPISSDFLRIAAKGQITLSGDVATKGQTVAEQGLVGFANLSKPNVFDTPLPANGSYFLVTSDGGAPGSFIQTGTVNVTPSNGPLATLRIQLPTSGGTIVLNDLNAPSTDLILFTLGGTARGTVNLAGLTIVGKSGSTDLLGLINGLNGSAAANKGTIGTTPDANYRFNSCPVGSVNCVLTPVNTVPPTNPLRGITIGGARSIQDDADLILPNVSDEDY